MYTTSRTSGIQSIDVSALSIGRRGALGMLPLLASHIPFALVVSPAVPETSGGNLIDECSPLDTR